MLNYVNCDQKIGKLLRELYINEGSSGMRLNHLSK